MHVDDLAESIYFLIENKVESSLINIGTGEEVTIKELAEKIKNTIGFEGDLIFDDKMLDGNPRKLLDSSLIKSWQKPKINLETGLENTYNWFLKNNPKTKWIPKNI